ncbi:helix-turn-helix domain-containing protein [Kineosporia succinea]|uniref:DUF5753 domain-containing protein n=1 Tax=Kineosporia succinea TaxID=84632 RepID=A0ABT9PAX6_9ACTN|nr:helix-turn-helix transcriptional regulator [Kineosporia succinea]MDP9829852.1 hypothetical protein [Kineosporia succinea]
MSGGGAGQWSVGLELSKELREARERAGKTLGDVSAAKLGSRQKLWRIEHGVGPWKPADVGALCDLYAVARSHRQLLVDMAHASNDTTFTERYQHVPRFGLYLAMERRATALTTMTGSLVHGLLQTEGYHRGVMADARLFESQIEQQQLRMRQERQQAFWERVDVSLKVIMSEAALHAVVGSREVMAEQVGRLRALAGQEGVSIRYVPLSCPPGLVAQGPFTLLTTDQGESVYVEHLDGGRILSEAGTVGRFRHAAGLAEEQSVDMREWQ